MAGLSDYLAKPFLNFFTGEGTAAPFTGATHPTAYIGLFTAVGATPDSWTSGSPTMTEVTGGSYARVNATSAGFNASSGTMPSSITNSGAITFPQASANWGTVIAFGLFDASTAGDLLAWDYLGGYNWLPFTCTSVSSGNGTVINAPGIASSYGGGFSSGSVPVVFDYEYGGTVPTSSQGLINTSSPYYLLTANVSGDTFTVTNGGVAVTTSSTGSGMVRPIVAQTINSGVTASFASTALTIYAA